MPGWAWVAIAAIAFFSIVQVVGLLTGRSLSSGSSDEQVKMLEKRIHELESAESPQKLDGDTGVPTKSEENMAAEDRWRLDMLEARLEELEEKRKKRNDDDAE